MSDGDLSTIAALQADLGGAWDSTQTGRLQAWLSGVSQFFKNQANHPILADLQRERRSGNGADFMALRYGPIRSVAAVTINGADIPQAATERDQGFDYEVDGPRPTIFLRGYTFAVGRLNVALTYIAGWEDVPADVELWTRSMVARLWKRHRNIDVSSIAAGQQTTSFIQAAMSATDREIIRNYLNLGMMIE